jgi:hypothetical protein
MIGFRGKTGLLQQSIESLNPDIYRTVSDLLFFMFIQIQFIGKGIHPLWFVNNQ